MATFTRELKRELARTKPTSIEGRRAAVAAFLYTSGAAVAKGRFSLSFEIEHTAAYVSELIEEEYGEKIELSAHVKTGKRDADKLTFTCRGEIADRILHDAEEFFRSAEEQSDKARIAFIRAAFLSGGGCTLPSAKTGYHLEFVLTTLRAAETLAYFLDGFGLIVRIVERGGKEVAYLKSREGISDFLSLAGAERALKKFDEVGEEREESNNLNRVENCYSGNADRSATASAKQVMAITALKERRVYETLDEGLKETAEARLHNPTFSMDELARALRITKSCLNHRLRRIMELYKSGEKL